MTTYSQDIDWLNDRRILYRNGIEVACAIADESTQACFAEIVRKCNSHAALVSALEKTRDFIADQHGGMALGLTDPLTRPVLLAIGAALATTKAP